MNSSQLRVRQSKPRLGRCALAAALLAAGAAHAQDGGISARFSGFGTLGVAHSSEKNADFTGGGDQPNGAGTTRNWDFNPDSKLAGQVDVKFNDKLSATAQAIARYGYDGSYTPDVMLAYGKWQVTPEVAVRAGRMMLPIFLISDSRMVGYSQAQLRPPIDMYHAFYLYHYDGADLTWSTNAGGVALKSQAYLGSTKPKVPNEVHIKASPIGGFSLKAESGDMTLWYSYNAGKLAVSSAALDGAFLGVRYGFPAGSLGPGSPAIPGSPDLADEYEVKDKFAQFTGLGFNYDPGSWFVTGEAGLSTQAAINPRQTFGYLTGGMRFGDFTPYATASMVKTKIAGSTTNNPVLDAIRQASAAISQKSLGIGLRWDAMKNVAIKTQFDYSKPDSDSNGRLTNIQPGFQQGKGYSVFSVAVDFVF